MRKSVSRISSARQGFVTAFAVGALALTACGNVGNAGSESSSESHDVTIALPVPLGLFWSPYIIAAEKFYPEWGIKASLPSVDGSAGVAQQIATGNAFAGSVSIRETYAARAAGAKIHGIAAFGRGMTNDISVPEDSPVQSLKDLRGKAIGVPSASDGSIALIKTLMKEAGISEDEYDLPAVGKGGPAVAAAFEANRIAAYAHGQSDIVALRVNAGLNMRSLMPERYLTLPAEGLVVAESTMADPESRDLAIKLVQGFYLGGWFVQDHPEEAKEIVCKVVPADCTDPAYVDAVFELVGERKAPLRDGKAGTYDYEGIQLLLDITLGEGLTVPIKDAFTSDYLELINNGLLDRVS